MNDSPAVEISHGDVAPTNASRGSVILLTVAFVTAFLAYVFNVALGWLLPIEDYGLYGVCVALLGVLGIFIALGFPWAVTRFLPAEESREKRYTIVKSSILGNFITAVAVSAIFYAIYSYFIGYEKLPAILMLIIVASLPFNSVVTVQTRTLQGLFRFRGIAMVQILAICLRVVIGIGLVYLGYGVLGALTGFVAASLAAIVIAAYLLRDFKFWQGRGWVDFKVYIFIVPMFLGMIGLTLLPLLSILGLKFLSFGAVSNELAGYYQAVYVLAAIPTLITVAMMDALFPFISKRAEVGSHDYSVAALRYVVLFVCPLAIAVALIPRSFITFFFPSIYTAGANALAVAAIGMGVFAIAYVLANTFQAIGKPKVPAIILLVALGIQIASLVLLVPKLGLIGAAASTTIASFFSTTWLLLRYNKMYRLHFRASQVLSLVSAFTAAGAFLFLFPHVGRMLTVVDLILAAIIYLFLLMALRLINERDVRILSSALPQHRLVKIAVEKAARLVITLNNITKAWR